MKSIIKWVIYYPILLPIGLSLGILGLLAMFLCDALHWISDTARDAVTYALRKLSKLFGLMADFEDYLLDK